MKNKQLQVWWQKRQEKVKQTEISTARESILFLLSNELTTEESVNLFNDVYSVYVNRMNQRLVEINNEKVVLEQFRAGTMSSDS